METPNPPKSYFAFKIPESIDESPRFFESNRAEEDYIEKMAAFYWQSKFGLETFVKNDKGKFVSNWLLESYGKNNKKNDLFCFRMKARGKIYGIQILDIKHPPANEIIEEKIYRESLYSLGFVKNQQLTDSDLSPKLIRNILTILEDDIFDKTSNYQNQNTDELFNTDLKYRKNVIQRAIIFQE